MFVSVKPALVRAAQDIVQPLEAVGRNGRVHSDDGGPVRAEGRASKPASKPAPKPEPQRDAKLAALLAEAYAARQLVLDNPETPLADLAKQHGKCRKHLARMVELSCLAPDIVTAILEGKQPRSLSAASLRSRQLPLSWEEQRAALLEAWIRCLHPA